MKIGFSPFAHPAGDITPFDGLFKEAYDLTKFDIKGLDAILLWGGTDINPAFYKDEPHPYNGFNPHSTRDIAEWAWMQEAIKQGVPIIGICRGAQFICAVAGGKLIQDVTGHGTTHDITVIENGEEKVYQTSSSHHQMLYPFNLPDDSYVLKGWSTHKRSKKYDGESPEAQRPVEREPEVVLFPKIRALAIQGHPEWQHEGEPFVKWCVNEVAELVGR